MHISTSASASNRINALKVKERVNKVARTVMEKDNTQIDLDPEPGKVALSADSGADVTFKHPDGLYEQILQATASFDPDSHNLQKADITLHRYFYGDPKWSDGDDRITFSRTERRSGLGGIWGKKRPVNIYTIEHKGVYRSDKSKDQVIEDIETGELKYHHRGWVPSFKDFDLKQAISGGFLGLAGAGMTAGANTPGVIAIGIGVIGGGALGALAGSPSGHPLRSALAGAATLTGIASAGAYGGLPGVLAAGGVMFLLGGLGIFSHGE